MALKVATLNINGLNVVNKQMSLVSVLRYHKIDVLMLQEHNLKNVSDLDYMSSDYHIILNSCANLKGGTAICIRKCSNVKILNQEMDAEGQITSVRVDVNGSIIPILNVYAPSGSSKKREREDFFRDKIIFYLRGNSENLIFGGDFNCVISQRDVSSRNENLQSKALSNLLKQVGLKDITKDSHQLPEYTFVRNNYGSRLDRLYVKSLFDHISSWETIPISFSDHNMVLVKLNVKNMKVGKGFWRLNTKILDFEETKENFSVLWSHIVRKKDSFDSILLWWEFAKEECKRFFIRMSKRMSQEKYGLLNLLQERLKQLYARANAGGFDYEEIRLIKDRVNEIQNDICEGIKLRTKLKDKVDGEKVSAYLLGKEKSKSSNILKIKTKEGVLTNTDSILHFFKRYFTDLYDRVETDENSQGKLLDFCKKNLNEEDENMLTREIEEKEIWAAIKGLSGGKSPGKDGLPIEFYKTFWSLLKPHFIQVIRCGLKEDLTKSQHEGVLKLLPKSGDLELAENWRPISLLNVDYKICAKVLANRMRTVMSKVISPEQYCGVNGRSIIDCNNMIRDVVYFSTEMESNLALLNLDWSKAFDRVDTQFLWRIMRRLGFPESFVNWLMILYKNSQSCLCINGVISSSFEINRSVRQGCPLSMLLFVIFQEPLYLAIKNNKEIPSPKLPNEMCIKLQGYADDSTIFICDEESLVTVFREVRRYEKATGAKLNTDKTKILGFSGWKNKSSWGLDWVKSVNKTKILGIEYTGNYEETCKQNWENIKSKIARISSMLEQRNLTIYQKGIIINASILSKVWYIAHTFPLSKHDALAINSSVFKFLWHGMYQPIRRTTLCLPKSKGGLGIFDVYHKALSILCCTVVKEVTNDLCLSAYYCKIKLSYLIDTREIKEVSYISSPYYATAIEIIRKVIKCKNFPLLTNKMVYDYISPAPQPIVCGSYPLFDWENIWRNMNNKILGLREREFMYKYIHETLATNMRLRMLKIKDDGSCDRCGEEEYQMHIFYTCTYTKDVFMWFKNVLFNICSIKRDSFLRILMLDFKCRNEKCNNVALVLIVDYLYVLWVSKKKYYDSVDILKFLKSKLMYSKWLYECLFKKGMQKVFNDKYIGYDFN